MRTLDIIARAIVGAIGATFVILASEHWSDQELRKKGCIATGKPGVETELAKGITVIGRVWFCQEKSQ